MRRRLEVFIPIVLLSIMVQLMAPIGAFRAVAYADSDPLHMAAICSGMASSQDASQTTPANAQHGANCCGFCSVGHGGAVAVDPPPLIFVVLQRQYQLSHGWKLVTICRRRAPARTHRRERHPPFPDDPVTPMDGARPRRPCLLVQLSQAGPRAGVRNIHVSSCITGRACAQLAAGIGRRVVSPLGAEAQTRPSTLPPVTVTAPEQQRATSARPPRNAARSARTVRQTRALGAADGWRSAGYRRRRPGGAQRAAGADRDQQHPGRRRGRASRGLQEFDRCQHHQGYPGLLCPACSRSRNGATTRGYRSAAPACRAISICAACSSTWTAFPINTADGYGDFQEIDQTAYKYVEV